MKSSEQRLHFYKSKSKQMAQSRFLSYQAYDSESLIPFITKEAGILFVLKGKMEYEIGEDEIRILKSGEYLFYPKGITIHLTALKDTCILLFHLKREIIQSFIESIQNYGSRPFLLEEQAYRVCIFQEETTSLVDNQIEEVISIFFDGNKDVDFFLYLSLQKLMYYIFSDNHMLSKLAYLLESPFYPETLVKIEAFLIENYHQPIRMKQLLQVVNISESQLNRLYKKYFQVSVMERLTAIRMEQAALLLRNPSITVTDTAVQVGYQSISAFVQQFKKKFGLSPKEFQSNAKI